MSTTGNYYSLLDKIAEAYDQFEAQQLKGQFYFNPDFDPPLPFVSSTPPRFVENRLLPKNSNYICNKETGVIYIPCRYDFVFKMRGSSSFMEAFDIGVEMVLAQVKQRLNEKFKNEAIHNRLL